MVAKTAAVTAAELLAMPDDGYRYELVRGELRKMAPAGAYHSKTAIKIGAALLVYAAANNLGEVFGADGGFRIGSDPDHVLSPDAAFVRRERIAAIGLVDGYWPGAPDLAVEVISPNDRYTEVEEKVADWLAAGVLLVALVNPRNRTVTCRCSGQSPVILTEQDTLEGGDVVPGWQMAVGDIFA